MLDVEQSRWTLSFVDGELERSFRDDFARRTQQHYRVVVSVGFLLWLAVFLIDDDIGGTAVNTRWLVGVRLAAVPPFAVGMVVGFLSERRFARWSQLAGSLTLAVAIGSVVIMGAGIPEPAVYDSRQAVTGFVLAVLVGYAAVPLRMVAAAIPGLVASSAMVVVLLRTTDHGSVTVLWLVMANVIGVTAAYIIEQNRRRAFLYGRMVEEARGRADALIDDLLPAAIAERLKHDRSTIADSHPSATVLFADLVGFTPMAAKLSPAELVSTLDALFSRFDRLVAERGVEKIKTIGDGYMAVGGVPTEVPDHAVAMVDLALAMQREVEAYDELTVRIGIHTGPVVAGVIGEQRLVYDLWGDTVNTASRMESHGVDGSIHVSETTAALVREQFALEDRGEIQVKGKGAMRTYLVRGRRGE